MPEETRDARRDRLFAALPDWYRPVLAVADPEVAFGIGAYHLLLGNPTDGVLGDTWFMRAVELGGPGLAWRAADEHVEWGRGRIAAWWMRHAITVEYPASGSGGITVDPALFALQFNQWGFGTGQDFTVQVVCGQPEHAAAALAVARRRFMLITSDGREVASHDDLDDLLAGAGSFDADCYTPNWVSDPEPYPDGPAVAMDCKDGTMPLMARTMIRVLIEELRAAGVAEAELRPRP